jgi:putative flippase GtrA
MLWRVHLPINKLRELYGYALASACALAVDATTLLGLTRLTGIPYYFAAPLGFLCGGLLAYAVSVGVVFRHRRFDRSAVELPIFLLIGVVGAIVNSLVMWALISSSSMALLQAKLCAAVLTFSTNFLLRRYMLFRPITPSPGLSDPVT